MVLNLFAPGEAVRLWNAQEVSEETDVPGNVLTAVGTDASEAILSLLEADERITLVGRTVGLQRIREGVTNATDPARAAAEWAREFETWVNGSPGTAGISLENAYSGRTVSCVPESLSWAVDEGAPGTVRWSLTVLVGGGVDADLGLGTGGTTSVDRDRYGGVTLPNVRERRVERSIDTTTIRAVLSEGAEDNEVLIDSGLTRRVTLSGRVPGDPEAQRVFDDDLRSFAGTNQTATFEDAWAQTSRDMAVLGYSGTRRAGRAADGDYALELVEGQTL